MRTTMNYQYRFGTSTTEAMKHLWREGKIRRFYRGYGPALLQGPISRFGDTAANVGILALLESNTELPIALKTGAASITAGVWRIFIMPIDTVKTTLQVIGTFQALSKLLYVYIRFRKRSCSTPFYTFKGILLTNDYSIHLRKIRLFHTLESAYWV